MALLTPFEEEEQSKFKIVVLYGEVGSGKTSSAMRLANRGRIIVVRADPGMHKGALKAIGINTGNILVHAFEHFGDIKDLYWALKAKFDEDPDFAVAMVWDSMSMINKKLVDNEVARRLEKKTKVMSGVDEFEVDREVYGKVTEQLRWINRYFFELPCHQVVISQEKQDKDKNEGTIYYRPYLSPAYSSDLLGVADVVISQVAEVDGNGEVQRFGYTVPFERRVAKDQLHLLPARLENLDMAHVAAYIEGEIEPASEEERTLNPELWREGGARRLNKDQSRMAV